VSSREQEETGYSLPSQEKLLKDYALRKSLSVLKVFSVAESASGSKQRKVFGEMMAYIDKNKITNLLCEKVDRLTRNLKEAVVANEWVDSNIERQIHFVKQNLVIHKFAKSDEKFRWDIEIVLAKKYIANLSEEVKKGQKEKLAQGWLPTRPPIGYKTIGDKGHKTHIVDHDKAPFIKKMFELYSTGNYSTTALVDVMYKEGLRNASGKKVGKSILYELLTNPFYYGQMKWNEFVFQGKQEAIITKDLFDLVQDKLNRKFKVPSYTKHLPVFKAKMECSDCKGTVTWEIQKGHWYGHCNHYKACKQKTWWRQEKVEDTLFPMFDNIAPKSKKVLEILEKALKESHGGEIEYHSKSANELNKRIEVNQHRLEAIYEDKIDNKISPEFYNRKFAEYTKDKEDALLSLKKLNEGNTKYYEAGYAIHELASKASEIYKSPKATTEDKRLLLSKIFSNLSLNSNDIEPDYTLAFEFLIKWIPLVNNTFEPVKDGSIKGKESTFVPSHPALLRVVEDVRTWLGENNSTFYVPILVNHIN
jgi:DNA invertase Pin-like site-specific DNA recombinase